jgi:hypothetical protein
VWIVVVPGLSGIGGTITRSAFQRLSPSMCSVIETLPRECGVTVGSFGAIP